jgi:hypothetical protein
MTNQHPIVPPPDKIHNWLQLEKIGYTIEQIITVAAQYGADQELEACCEYVYERLKLTTAAHIAQDLRTSRRPKPPSLKEQALLAIDTAVADDRLSADVAAVVRRALEALPE